MGGEKVLLREIMMTNYYEPELGELCFGAAWGTYKLDDDWVNEELCELIEIIITKQWKKVFAKTITLEQVLWGIGYGTEFKNGIFEIHSYYWGDCICGYNEKENHWSEENKHEETCYQNLVEEELKKFGWKSDKWGYLNKPEGTSYQKADKIKDEIRKKYCERFDLSFPAGCAAHCTCSYEERWQEFISKNGHNPECPIVRPNFKHFKSGIEIRWYKYIGRGMSINKSDITRNDWRKIFHECRESLNA